MFCDLYYLLFIKKGWSKIKHGETIVIDLLQKGVIYFDLILNLF